MSGSPSTAGRRAARRRAVLAILILILILPACGGPSGTTAITASGTPTGFEWVAVRLTEADGSVCERCLLLAETAEQHRRGLMRVTSLGGFDGIAFRYAEPTSTEFWMRDTVLPLSIAFYDAAGGQLDTFAMDPCSTTSCPSFGPQTPFSVAVEVAQGELDELGFTAGATLELLDVPCTPAQNGL